MFIELKVLKVAMRLTHSSQLDDALSCGKMCPDITQKGEALPQLFK